MSVILTRRHMFAAASAVAVSTSVPAVFAAGSVENKGATVIRDSYRTHTFTSVPERVVVLQWDTLESVLALGIVPVGAADIKTWPAWVSTPAMPEATADVGTRAEPNLERIAALKPDLIIAGPSQAGILARLADICPILIFENARADNPVGQAEGAVDQMRTLAKIFKREEKAEEVIAWIDAELLRLSTQIREAFGVAPGGAMPSVQVIRFSSPTTAFIYTPNSIADYALRKMGMQQPITEKPASYGLTQRRIKEFKDLRNEYIVYLDDSSDKKVLRSILWTALPVVRNGHVAPGSKYWSHGGAVSIVATAKSVAGALLSIAPNSVSGKTNANKEGNK